MIHIRFYCETIKFAYRECAGDLDHTIQVERKTRPSSGCTVVVKEVDMNKKEGEGKMEGGGSGRVETIMTIVKRNVEQITMTSRTVMHPRKAVKQSASPPLEKSTPTVRSLCGLVTAFRASKHAQVPIIFVALVFGKHVASRRPSGNVAATENHARKRVKP